MLCSAYILQAQTTRVFGIDRQIINMFMRIYIIDSGVLRQGGGGMENTLFQQKIYNCLNMSLNIILVKGTPNSVIAYTTNRWYTNPKITCRIFGRYVKDFHYK